MTFLERRIPTAVRRHGTGGGPTAKRRKVYNESGGLVQQIFLRSAPLHRYRFDFGNKKLEDAEAVRDFFYVVMFGAPGGGGYEGFRARDWNDYELTQTKSRLVNISGTEWQIYRVYAAGAAEYLRKVKKTEAGTEIIYRTRASVVSVATATVDEDTGIADISGHVGGDTYTCEANFDVPVTFESDDALANVALDGNVEQILQSFGEIELEELP
jgi:uncharacterized protein (TIGR02217 family)